MSNKRNILVASVSGVVLLATIAVFIIVAAQKTPTPVSVAIVAPHHDIFKSKRLELWQALIEKRPSLRSTITQIFLVGPDHFGTNQNLITYDSEDWRTISGVVENPFVRPEYFTSAFASNTILVKDDHAVTSLVGELHANFPSAKFTPFLIGSNVKFDQLSPLLEYLNKSCQTTSCLLVASVDFSHYLTLDVADEQDAHTITLLHDKTIREDSLNQTDNIEADSPASLYVLQEFARSHSLDWWFFDHTNSALGDYTTTDTTSHVYGGYLP